MMEPYSKNNVNDLRQLLNQKRRKLVEIHQAIDHFEETIGVLEQIIKMETLPDGYTCNDDLATCIYDTDQPNLRWNGDVWLTEKKVNQKMTIEWLN